MCFRVIAVLSLTFVFNSALADCPEFGEYAKYSCAKDGDAKASVGDYRGAMNSWKKSCNHGLDSSCDLYKSYKKDEAKFRSDFKISKDMFDCTSGNADEKKCINTAKKNLSEDPERSVALLESICSNDNVDACFTLGKLYYKANDLQNSERTYDNACMNGHSPSCTALDRVTKKMERQSRYAYQEQSLNNQRQIASEQAEANRLRRNSNRIDRNRNQQLQNINSNIRDRNSLEKSKWNYLKNGMDDYYPVQNKGY